MEPRVGRLIDSSAPAPPPPGQAPRGTARIVVYTAIAGGIDRLREPRFVSPGIDYVCFTDDPRLKSRHWELRPFDERFDPARTAKKPKILPHRYFPLHEVSVWVDGNHTVRGDLAELAERYLQSASLSLYEHPEGRTSIYEEAEACLRMDKDDPRTIRRQLERYRAAGYPATNGLPACMVIVRRHHDPEVVAVMESWWREIRDGSRRDQISFPYVAWRHGLRYATIPGNVRDNRYVVVRPHDAKRLRRRVLGVLAGMVGVRPRSGAR